jgi:hypothetical protein
VLPLVKAGVFLNMSDSRFHFFSTFETRIPFSLLLIYNFSLQEVSNNGLQEEMANRSLELSHLPEQQHQSPLSLQCSGILYSPKACNASEITNVQVSSFLFLGWSATESTKWPTVPAPDDKCGAIARMLGRGNQSTGRKPDPVPLSPPQIPHDLAQAQTRTTAVGSRQLTV